MDTEEMEGRMATEGTEGTEGNVEGTHTPLLWVVEAGMPGEMVSIAHRTGQVSFVVADVHGSSLQYSQDAVYEMTLGQEHEAAVRDAEFMVRACNAYEGLVVQVARLRDQLGASRLSYAQMWAESIQERRELKDALLHTASVRDRLAERLSFAERRLVELEQVQCPECGGWDRPELAGPLCDMCAEHAIAGGRLCTTCDAIRGRAGKCACDAVE